VQAAKKNLRDWVRAQAKPIYGEQIVLAARRGAAPLSSDRDERS